MAVVVDSVTILPLPAAYTVAAGTVRNDVVIAVLVTTVDSTTSGAVLAGVMGLKSILACCMGATTAAATSYAFTTASITPPAVDGARTFFVLGVRETANS